ncbi:hypothetical protein ACEWY4_017319 [Coilia grayii]|uniref:Ig-like domain-containing protein n=1 Tax=Coilia grayii TaxID=363190 RepID=A0ABD1JHY6_9TELE
MRSLSVLRVNCKLIILKSVCAPVQTQQTLKNDSQVTEVFWIINATKGVEPIDLISRPEYEGRVQYSAHKENNCTLTLSDVRVADTALYYARIVANTNKWQSEQRVTFTVKDPPKNTLASVSPAGEILEGSSVILTCSSDANPPVQSYTWYRRRGGAASVVGSQQNYSMTYITSEHSGLYYCMAENQHGSSHSTDVHLDVQYAPKYVSITASPSGDLIENSTMTLSCSSDANPAVQTYTWYRRMESAVSKAAAHQNYSIGAVSSEHSGDYYCQAQNKHGNRNSTVTHLNVLYPPKRTSLTLNHEGQLEDSLVTLTCSSDANPSVETYTWYRRTGDKTTQVGSGQTYSFTLTSTTAGHYHCQASNRHGYQNSAPVEIFLTGGVQWQTVGLCVLGAIVAAETLGLGLMYFRRKTRGSTADSGDTRRNTGVRNTYRNTGVRNTYRNTGVRNTYRNTGVSDTDRNTGVSDTDRNTGVSDTDRNTGVSDTDRNTGVSDTDRNTGDDDDDYANDPQRGNPGAIQMSSVNRSHNPNTTQPDDLYQSLNPNTIEPDAVYQSLKV